MWDGADHDDQEANNQAASVVFLSFHRHHQHQFSLVQSVSSFPTDWPDKHTTTTAADLEPCIIVCLLTRQPNQGAIWRALRLPSEVHRIAWSSFQTDWRSANHWLHMRRISS